MRSFAEKGGYYYSTINETEFDKSTIEKLFKMLS